MNAAAVCVSVRVVRYILNESACVQSEKDNGYTSICADPFIKLSVPASLCTYIQFQ